MAKEIIYNDGDCYIKFTITFPTGNDWSDYTYVQILMYDKDETLLQTNGYGTGTWDIDLVVPDETSGVCYYKIDYTNISSTTGLAKWVLKARSSDSDFGDSTFDPVDKLNKFYLQ